MSSALDRLGDLRPEAADRREFESLRAAGEAFLADARNEQLAPGSRFTLAYDAAYSYSLAALRHRGYRAKNRYIVFQVLPHTLGAAREVWLVLAKAHEMRNAIQYQGEFAAGDRILTDLIIACEAVRAALDKLPPL